MSPSFYNTYFHDDLKEVGGGDLVRICQTLVDIDCILLPGAYIWRKDYRDCLTRFKVGMKGLFKGYCRPS